MRRRDLLAFLGGAAVQSPLTVAAQENQRMRRIGYLSSAAEDDSVNQTWIRVFMRRLEELGWTSDRNVQIDVRLSSADAMRLY